MSPSHKGPRTGIGAASMVLVALLALHVAVPSRAHADPQTAVQAEDQAIEMARGLSAAFERVAGIIRPSVVSISSTKRVGASTRGQPSPESPWRDFFGDDFFERFFNTPGGRGYLQQGIGTGVVVSDDGYVLTNNHVVAEADEVNVRFDDGRNFEARIVGTDPKTDLAVLRIDSKNLQPAKLGDSDELRIGEWVVAAGSPFGLASSITAGIVSAKGRSNLGIADYEDFIQTDAAINPGNSGGPLVNLRGEVVGISTAIFTRSGGYMGIGFAIPINMAESVMTSLIKEGRVVRGWLGVSIQDLNADLARTFGYKGTGGVAVIEVVPKSPAARAGIEPEDVILSFAGKKPANTVELRSMVAATRPGTDVELEIFRKGRTRSLRLEVGELENEEVAARADEPSQPDLGLSVRTLTPDLARRAGYAENMEGVIVVEVDPFGPAGRAGIRDNDVILRVHDTDVHNASEFERAVKSRDLRDGVRLTVRTGENRRFVFVRTES